jgi:hypothetical protein
MLNIVALILLATVRNVTHGPVEPTIAIDSSCYGSNYTLGTGNVPYNTNGRASSIVNIWAELPRGGGKAVAWIAKTESGAYWIQFDGKIPQRMTSFTEYASQFHKIGAATSPCYLHDLPSKYVGDVLPTPGSTQ